MLRHPHPHHRRQAVRHFDAPTFATILALSVSCTAPGCGPKAVEQPVEHTVRKVTPETAEPKPEAAAPADAKATGTNKEEFERMLTASLERLDEEIRELRMRAGTAGEAAKAQWTETMAEIETKRKAAEARLEEVRKSAREAWEHLREGADRAWEDLERAVKKAEAEH